MANGTPQPVLLLPNVITAGSVVLASLTVDAKGRVTAASSAAVTGSGSVVLATSPTIVTPTIASFTNATHTHQNAAGGGSLDAAAIATGVLANAQVNWASPSAIGGTAAAAASFSLIGVGQAAATYPVEITTAGFTGFIVKKSSSLGFSLSAYYPTLAFNMFYNGSNWVAIGAGPTGMWQQDAITGTMAFSMRATDATAGENMGSYGSLDRLSITKAGLTSLKATDAATAAVTNVLTAGHYLTTANAGANNIGTGIVFQAADSTSAIGAGVNVAQISAVLDSATDASYKSSLRFSAYSKATGATPTLGLTVGNDGTAATIGLFGVAAIERPTTAIAAASFTANTSGIANDTATWGGYKIGQIVQALINLGALT